MTVGVLREFASVVLNGSGAGTVKIGPTGARERWRPSTVSVSANANPTNESTCNIYIGDANTFPTRLIDSTVNGSSGDSTGNIDGKSLKVGEFVWAVWTGGDAGQRATMVVLGEKDV
jgi:hypothetical protein